MSWENIVVFVKNNDNFFLIIDCRMKRYSKELRIVKVIWIWQKRYCSYWSEFQFFCMSGQIVGVSSLEKVI